MASHGDVEDLADDAGDVVVAGQVREHGALGLGCRGLVGEEGVVRRKGLRTILAPALPPPTMILWGLMARESAFFWHWGWDSLAEIVWWTDDSCVVCTHKSASKESLRAYGNGNSGALVPC